MKTQLNPTIKAHLLRGAFYLLLLLAVCVIPFALGQRDARTADRPAFHGVSAQSQSQLLSHDIRPGLPAGPPRISSGPAGARLLRLLPMPRVPDVILYDQYDNAGALSTGSQNFEPDFDAFDDFTADDFVVPGGETWNITEVDVLGTYFNGSGPANSFNVFVYQDSGGLPGANVYTALDQSFTSADNFNFVISLSSAAVLPAGTYWVSVQANLDFGVGGQWGWTDRTVQSNSPAAWQNPGGGFGICLTWGYRGDPAGCNIDPGVPDQVYRLVGTTGGGTPTPTATTTPSATPTSTPTSTPSVTPSVTPTTTPSMTPSVTPSVTPSPSPTPSVTPSVTPTPSPTPTVTPTPSATPGECVFGFGYWKNHPEAWPVTELQLGNVTYTQEELLSIMHEPVRGNGLISLAHHLITAKLNVANGADPSCIQQTIADADALIGDLVVPPVGDGYLAPRDVNALKDTLEAYNEGQLCAPSCDNEGSPTPAPTTTPPRSPRRPPVMPHHQRPPR
jgi:hypothetical protein